MAETATAPREFQELAIPRVVLVTPRRFGDSRGFFSETWNAARYEAAGISGPFVQDNHSLSAHPGTVRGLHCQIGASVQGKLVRVVRGAIWDVAVDLRVGSPTWRRRSSRSPTESTPPAGTMTFAASSTRPVPAP